MSPLVGTFSGASVRGFGFLSTSLGGSYWFGEISNGGRVSTNYNQFVGTFVDANDTFYGFQQLDTTAGLNSFIKIDSTRAITLQKTITASTQSGNCALGIQADTAGNFTIASLAPTSGNGIVAKFDSTGTQVWSKGLGHVSSNGITMRQASTSTTANIYTYESSILTKIDSTGTGVWARTYTLGSTQNMGMGVDASENIYCVGAVGTSASLLLKYNSSGTLQWSRQTPNSTHATTTFVIDSPLYVDSSGNSYLINGNASTSPTQISKIDNSGTLSWSRQLTFTGGSARIYGVTTDTSGNVYVSGYYGTASPYNGFVAKYNSSGTIQWQRNFNNSSQPTYSTNITRVVSTPTAVWATGQDRNGNSAAKEVIFKIPQDGSLTGTYAVGSNNWVYSTSTLTDSAGTITLTNPAVTDAAASLSVSNSSQTIATITSTTINTKVIP